MTPGERSDTAPHHGTSPNATQRGSKKEHNRQTRRRWILVGLIAAVALPVLAVVLLACLPGRVDPQAWTPPQPPPMTGPLSVNDDLVDHGHRIDTGAAGPEAFAIDHLGRVYTGHLDGTIVRFHLPAPDPESDRETLRLDEPDAGPSDSVADLPADAAIPIDIAPETVITLPDGRPLGMDFTAAGRLIVADARLGLVEVDVEAGTWSQVVTSDDEGPLGFVDDLDIATDGTIYFTDATRKWDLDTYPIAILELPGDGRVYAWHPADKRLERLASGLQFANGIALTADESALLVTETATYRVLRISLDRASRGEVTVLIENLPGYPDNIRLDPATGRAWIAMASIRKPIADAIHPHPWLKRVICRLPRSFWPAPAAYGLAVSINGESGGISRSLHDPDGQIASNLSTVQPLEDGRLLLGTYDERYAVIVSRDHQPQ